MSVIFNYYYFYYHLIVYIYFAFLIICKFTCFDRREQVVTIIMV